MAKNKAQHSRTGRGRREFLIKGRRRRDRRHRVRRGPAERLGGGPREHRRALSGHRQHGADRPGLRRRRQARGRDGQRRRRHQIARRRQAQSHPLRRAERHHGHAHGNRPADLRQQAVRGSRLLCLGAHFDRQRSRGTRQSADHHRLELRHAQQGPHLYLHAVCARLAVRPSATANVEARSATSRRWR